jgi:hypothetical protein
MLVRNREKLVHPLEKPRRILLPEQVVQKHPHGVHADALGEAEFTVDRRQVERIGLPHLKLIDGAARNEVAAHQPRLPCIPGISLLCGPGLIRRGGE